MNGQEFVLDQLSILETNLAIIAHMADGQFIDLKVRPKDKRKKWTEKGYFDTMTKRIAYFRAENDSWDWKEDALFGVKAFTIACLKDQYQRFRDLWNIMHNKYVDPEIEKKKKARGKKIRKEQEEMDKFDRKRKCPGCGKPILIRDLQNNYIDKKKRAKRAVCGLNDDDTCTYANSSRKLRAELKPIITQVRIERKETKAAEERLKDKKRRLHGTKFKGDEP